MHHAALLGSRSEGRGMDFRSAGVIAMLLIGLAAARNREVSLTPILCCKSHTPLGIRSVWLIGSVARSARHWAALIPEYGRGRYYAGVLEQSRREALNGTGHYGGARPMWDFAGLVLWAMYGLRWRARPLTGDDKLNPWDDAVY